MIKNHNACCPSWTSTLNKSLVQGNITNKSGWYQSGGYIPKHEAPAFKFKDKQTVMNQGGRSNLSSDNDEKIRLMFHEEKCNELGKLQCLWCREEATHADYGGEDTSSPTYVSKNLN